MAIKQETIAMYRTDDDGNKVLQMPITTVENVEGLIVDLPIGHIYFSLEPTVPVGRIPAFGATYNRKLYADLWAYAQERGLVISEAEWLSRAQANGGNCAFYSDGDGKNTFRVPSMKCWVRGADGIEEVGSYLEAGLPNITGTGARFNYELWTPTNTADHNDGAILKGPSYGETQTTGSNEDTRASSYGWSFDASLSNAIYGNADTVQPPSLIGVWLIVAYGSVTNFGNADVANVMQAVEVVQRERRVVDVSSEAQTLNLSFSDKTYKQISLTSGVTVTAGTVSNGGTIPLPSGYTRAQCKYIVWHPGTTWNCYSTIDWGFSASVDQSTGKVTATQGVDNKTASTVQYVCVAVK